MATRIAITCWAITVVVFTVGQPVGPADAHTPHDRIVDVKASPSFRTDHTLLAISGNRVVRSTDGGINWTESTRGLTGKILTGFAFAPTESSTVYLASSQGGVYKSTDGGLSWNATNFPPAMVHVAAVAVSPSSANTVVAALAFGGVARTGDGGQTWTINRQVVLLNAMTFVPGDRERLIAADANGGMLVSDDAGATFEHARSDVNGDIATAVAYVGTQALVAGTRAGNALVSSDGGTSWRRVGAIAAGDRIESVVGSPDYTRDHTLWASAWHTGAHISTDGGETWSAAARGSTTDPQADQMRVPQFGTLSYAVGDRNRLYLGGFDGLFVWNDSTQRWSEMQTQAEYVSGLAVSPNYKRDGTLVVNSYVKGVFISRDRGENFAPSDHGLGDHLSEGNELLPLRRMHNVVFSPAYASDHTIFTATWNRFVKSTDRGETWKSVLVAHMPPSEELRQFVIAVSPDYARDRTIYLGTRQGIIYRSTARGDAGTWSTISTVRARVRSIVLSPAFASDHTMFLSTVSGIRASTDGGQTWSNTGPAGISLLAISPGFAHDRKVFAGTGHGFFVTDDGGQSWTAISAGLPNATNVAALAVSPAYAEDRTMLVSVAGKGLFRSTDGGQSFTATGTSLLSGDMVIADFDNPTSEPLQFSPQFARDKTVFAYAQQNVVRSTDGGTTWTVLRLPAASAFQSSWTRAKATATGAHRRMTLVVVAVAVVVVVAAGVLALRRRPVSARSPNTRATSQ